MQRNDKYTNIVIVGGGPVGLCLAAALKNMGLNPILLEKNPLYLRPGYFVLSPECIQLINDLCGEIVIEPSPSSIPMQIKDLERLLKAKIDKKGVTQLSGKFVNVTAGGLQYKKPSGEVLTQPCDLAFDATGTKRLVIEAVNAVLTKDKKEPAFIISNVAKNPIPTHFIANVGMDQKTAKTLEKISLSHYPVYKGDGYFILSNRSTSIKMWVALAKLRQNFDWPYMAIPFLLVGADPGKKNKAVIYLEKPPTLTKKQKNLSEQETQKALKLNESWVQEVLKLYFGDDVPFTHLKISDTYKEYPKPRFTDNYSQPKSVKPLFWKGENGLPTVIPIGDAQMESSYILGDGFKEGLKRLKILSACMTLEKDAIKIDSVTFQSQVQELMIRLGNDISKLYTGRQEDLKISEKEITDVYMAIRAPEDRVLFLQSAEKTYPPEEHLTTTVGMNISLCVGTSFDPHSLFENKNDEVNELLSTWKHQIVLCEEALQMMPNDLKNHRDEVLKKIAFFANKSKEIANNFSLGYPDAKIASNPLLAEQFSKFSLNVWKKYVSLCIEEIISAEKLRDANKMLDYANLALDQLKDQLKTSSGLDPDQQIMYIKIIRSKVNALLKQSGAVSDESSLKEILDEVDDLLKKLNSPQYKDVIAQINVSSQLKVSSSLNAVEQWQYAALHAAVKSADKRTADAASTPPGLLKSRE